MLDMATGKADSLENLNLNLNLEAISTDEINRLSEALKNEEFRKLFVEYAEEISNPDNRALYEKEIAELERQRGVNVEFLHPTPGHVIKTTSQCGKTIFVNICTHEKVERPSSERKNLPTNNQCGILWSIPHCYAPPRDDLTKSGNKCVIYDVMFHPHTYRMADTNEQFLKLVHSTALEGIEKQFKIKLDMENQKHIKLKYKGKAAVSVIRKKISSEKCDNSVARSNEVQQDCTYPPSLEQLRNDISNLEPSSKDVKSSAGRLSSMPDHIVEPEYCIKYRSNFDMQEVAKYIAKTREVTELIVEIKLPLLKSSENINLDVFEKRIHLETVKEPWYRLDFALPHSVKEDEGEAKFDRSKRKLIIKLAVLHPKASSLVNEDSNESGYSEEHEISSSGRSDDSPIRKPADDGILDAKCDTKSQENDENKSYNLKIASENSLIAEVELSEKKNIGEVGADFVHYVDDQSKEKNADDTEKIDLSEQHQMSSPGGSVNANSVLGSLPRYSYHQSARHLSITLYLKNVQADKSSVDWSSIEPRTVSIKLFSLGEGNFPMAFQLYVKTPEDLNEVQMDASKENTVIVLSKLDAKEWSSFHAGLDNMHLQEHDLMLQTSVDQKHKQAQKNVELGVEVTQLNKDRTEINVKIKKNTKVCYSKENEKECNMSERKSSEENIDESVKVEEVVTGKALKNCRINRSILKQRSFSESEEEILSASINSNSVISESSPFSEIDEEDGFSFSERKKSVSFSEYVDSTTYRINSSVSTLHATLKNKERRMKRRDNARSGMQGNGHRRRMSSGSDGDDSKVGNSQTLPKKGARGKKKKKTQGKIDCTNSTSTNSDDTTDTGTTDNDGTADDSVITSDVDGIADYSLTTSNDCGIADYSEATGNDVGNADYSVTTNNDDGIADYSVTTSNNGGIADYSATTGNDDVVDSESRNISLSDCHSKSNIASLNIEVDGANKAAKNSKLYVTEKSCVNENAASDVMNNNSNFSAPTVNQKELSDDVKMAANDEDLENWDDKKAINEAPDSSNCNQIHFTLKFSNSHVFELDSD